MMAAPASTEALATLARIVSTLSGMSRVRGSAARPPTTGITRDNSSSSLTRVAPGRVDSPPMSSSSAPCRTSSTPWAMAASACRYRPPSLKESGVTLTMPITRVWPSPGRSARSAT